MKTRRGGWIGRMAAVVVVAGIVACSEALAAGTNYVWAGGSATPPYSDWSTAATNIQTAIDYASTNLATYDTVLVTNGNYAVTSTISVTNGVKVIGFGGAAETIVYRTGASEFSVFTLKHANAVLDGFTITNGLASTGGGINMTAGTVRNCTIRENRIAGPFQGVGYGSGIYMTGGLVTNCLVTLNKEATTWLNGYGGGIYMTGGTVAGSVVSNNTMLAIWSGGAGIDITGGTVVDCIIVSNRVTSNYPNETPSHGGGGVVVRTGGVLDRSTIYGNQSDHRGGGVSVYGGLMKSCLVYGNKSTSATLGRGGGGVWMSGGAVVNCTVATNAATATQGGGVSQSGGGVTNTIVYFNSGTVSDTRNVYKTGGAMSYSCTTPAVAGTGNLIEDPLFVNLNGLDLRLQAASVCNDGGIILGSVTTDRAGNPRPVDFLGGGAIHDIGAYERPESPSTGELRCRFAGTPRRGLVGGKTVLTASAAGANTNGLAYYWHFTNGPSADLWGQDKQIVTNIYPAGTHAVRLVVSNNTPEGASFMRIAYIEAVPDQDAFVSTNGSNTYPYDSWGTAASDVNAALARLKTSLGLGGSSNTVWIGNGSYGVNATVLLDTNILVRGASGSAADSAVYRLGSAGNLSVFTLTHSNAVIEGLTVSNGLAYAGGGINMTAGTVRKCTIRGNSITAPDANTIGYGGGIYMTGGLVTNCLATLNNNGSWHGFGGGIWMNAGIVAGSVVSNNTLGGGSTGGAGIDMSGGTVLDCIIVGNRATTAYPSDSQPRGGGGVALGTGGVLDRSTIYGNQSDHRGGGASVYGGLMKNCLVYGNTNTSATLGRGGGGVWMSGGAVVNCTVATNIASATQGGGVSQSGGGVTNTIVYFNSGTVSDSRNVYQTGGSLVFSCVTPTVAGQGNITDDPLFTSLAGLDFRIKANSPCIDKGTNQAWMAGATDLAGTARVLGRDPDMGAYETLIPPSGTVITIR